MLLIHANIKSDCHKHFKVVNLTDISKSEGSQYIPHNSVCVFCLVCIMQPSSPQMVTVPVSTVLLPVQVENKVEHVGCLL